MGWRWVRETDECSLIRVLRTWSPSEDGGQSECLAELSDGCARAAPEFPRGSASFSPGEVEKGMQGDRSCAKKTPNGRWELRDNFQRPVRASMHGQTTVIEPRGSLACPLPRDATIDDIRCQPIRSGRSSMTGQGLPAGSSGTCGGRTIRQSACAKIFIIEESCLPKGSASSVPEEDVSSRART